MVKLVQDSQVQDGFPVVRWEQEVPTGMSAYSAGQSIALKIAAVVMVFVFVAVYAASEQILAAAVAALVVSGVLLRGDQMFKGGITVWNVHIKGPEPRPEAAEEERRARATAILGKQYCEARVAPLAETNELHFSVFRGTEPGKLEFVGAVPLASLQGLELGTAEEWFMDVAQAELRRTTSSPNSWVIVAPTLGHGVMLVAQSGGAKAAITALHGLLTKRFIVGAPEMQERWKAKLEEAGKQTGQKS